MQSGKGVTVCAYCDMCDEPIYVGGLYLYHMGEYICEACANRSMVVANDSTAMNEPGTVAQWARDMGTAYSR